MTWKNEKRIIFITGLYNKPQGCGASVASAARPFTTKKGLLITIWLGMCEGYRKVSVVCESVFLILG
jgi:hypothetical protein